MCVKCANSLFINDNQCVSACPSDKTLYKKWYQANADNSLSIIGFNRCFTKIANCDEAVPLDSQNQLPSSILYTCSKCSSGSHAVIQKNQDISHPTYQSHQEKTDYVITNEHFKVDCVSTAQEQVSASLANGWIANCSLYHLMISNQLGCFKCDHSYSGEVVDFKVDNCRTYKSTP